MKHALKRRGFTLIELMIALSAGTIAIGAVYYLGGTASQTYNTQMRVSETQMALRMAGEQVRRDFARAGYLAAPTATNTASAVCRPGEIRTPVAFQAVTITANGSVTAPIADLLDPNVARLDRVQLIANYATSEDYRFTLPTGSQTVSISPASQSFARSFGTTAAAWQVPFQNVFTAGRMLRIEDKDGGRYFYHIATSAGAVPIVTLSEIPEDCVATGSDSSFASPVMRIEYAVVPIDGTNTEAAFQGLESTAPGGQRMALVRREVNMLDGTYVNGSERIVLDFVTEFRVDAVIEPAAGTFQEVNDTTTPDVDTVPPEQLRSARVTLSARSPDVDRRVTTNIGRVNGAMVTFQVGAAPSDPSFGIARVRTLRSEIFMINLLR